MSKGIYLWIALVVMGVISGALAVLYFQEKSDLETTKAQVVQLQQSVDSLQGQLSESKANGQALQAKLDDAARQSATTQRQLDDVTKQLVAANNKIAELTSTPSTPPIIMDAYPGDGEITIEWQAPQGGGLIQRYILTGQPDSIIQTVPGNVAKSTVRGLTNGTKYRFTVTAEIAGGKTTTSDQSLSVVPAPLTVVAEKHDLKGNIYATGGNCGVVTFSVEVKLRKHDLLEVTASVFKDATLALKKPDGSAITRGPAKGIQSLPYTVESDGTYIIQVSSNFAENRLVACAGQYATAFVSYTVSRYALLATPAS